MSITKNPTKDGGLESPPGGPGDGIGIETDRAARGDGVDQPEADGRGVQGAGETALPGAGEQSPAGAAERAARPEGAPQLAAAVVKPLFAKLFPRGLPVRFVFWDGSSVGPESGPGRVTLHSPRAVSRLLWAPGELGVARAFVSGDLDADGDAFEILRVLHAHLNRELGSGYSLVGQVVRTASRLGVLGGPPAPPAVESRVRGRRHSKRRDRQAVTHHYDVGNDFYRLVLGPTMTYSCARFSDETMTLEEAQTAKHELVSRKLGLPELALTARDAGFAGTAAGNRAPARLLDIGCGWGSMAIHAAALHGAQVVGITLSSAQAELARRRVGEAGLDGAVEIRVQDYRDLAGETFDAISSIGMFEHVGARRMSAYFDTVVRLLRPGGRLLNHAISSVGGSKISRRSFVGRYVFPDGELIDVADVVRAMERAGFEVRDVESLREHYSRTLHAWVKNLEDHWEEAASLVGTARARVWWLYMTASANGFDDGGLSIHQVLGVVPGTGGESGMPRTRDGW
jgi:cyclopropane-fatty-acyl-phospholipid synthase